MSVFRNEYVGVCVREGEKERENGRERARERESETDRINIAL